MRDWRFVRYTSGLAVVAAFMGYGAVRLSRGNQPLDPGTIPPSSVPVVPALEGRLRVPEGFTVSYFAKGVTGARVMALGPDGAVYVTSTRPGQVIRLMDTDNDGVADDRKVAVSGLDTPSGLAFHGGWLYIANTGGVVRVRLTADGTAAGTPEVLNHLSPGGAHFTRTLLFGADSAMYVSVGSSCNVCIEGDSDRAGIMRYDENGQNGRLFASGLRNAVGLAVHPTTKEIWASTHERDNLPPDHQNTPPEEIDILQDGGHYGWPYCHSNQVPNPEPLVQDSVRGGFCQRTIPPALAMQAHSAPLGMTFLEKATLFPEEYRGDLLLALHGSWNRDVPVGAVVVRVRVRDGEPVAYEEFVSGWQDTPTRRSTPRRWGRPADVMVYTDGSVLVSEDSPGAIFRISR